MNTAALASSARRYAAVERRLFEVFGGWVPTVAEPDVKVALRVQSFRHGWHADLWGGLVPQARGLDGPAGGDSAMEDVLAAMADLSGTVERLAAAYRVVVPALVADYRSMRAEAVPASDGPLLRVLALVLADEESALEDGAALLVGRTAPEHEGRLRDLMAAARFGTENRQGA